MHVRFACLVALLLFALNKCSPACFNSLLMFIWKPYVLTYIFRAETPLQDIPVVMVTSVLRPRFVSVATRGADLTLIFGWCNLVVQIIGAFEAPVFSIKPT